MSRRPQNPTAERAAQNQQTLKTLVKVESNKTCADCKRNKHPRWASWNLGVFLCIRCSGIHRGMGTHISRVKSVDLDAWTDEQLQSILKWGNARANKYWEAKLAPGHAPAEAKIENFIRTKYDSKRWVMDGPMPDPSTLDAEGDDEMPLNVVQEKAKMERSASLRSSSNPVQTGPAPSTSKAPMVDLFADDTTTAPQRPNSAAPAASGPSAAPAPPPKQPTHAQKPSKSGESLLGFDFFSNAQPAPSPRPSSGASSTTNTTIPSRPDLKQSILSLYSSAPKQASTTQQQTSRPDSMSSNTQQSSGTGLDDAFSSLNFGSPPPQQIQPVSNSSSSFTNLASPPIQKGPPAEPKITSPGFSGSGGGGFFDSKPKVQTQPPSVSKPRGLSGSSGFGDFGDFTSAQPSQPTTAPKPAQGNGLGDLFDFSAPSQPAPAPKPATSNSSNIMGSPFNLSSPKSQAQPPSSNPPPIQAPTSPNALNSSSIMSDPWGSNDAWASSATNTTASAPVVTPASKPSDAPPKAAPINISSTGGDWGGGWGESPTATAKPAGGLSSGFGAPSPSKVTADEDYGGWEEAVPAPTSSNNPPPPPPKPMGFSGGGEDLFSNVWE